MRSPTNFEMQVYDAIKIIPKGKVVTYVDIARYLHIPKGARAVGGALNKNPNAPHVPCHRVVRSDGSIGGYAFGQQKKIALLKKEGVVIVKDMVDLERCRYVFSK